MAKADDKAVHERATKLGIYTICLCLGSTGPLYAGYMLAGGQSWRLYFYVEVAFAGLLLIMTFLFVEETAYKRHLRELSHLPLEATNKPKPNIEHLEIQTQVPARRSFLQSLKVWSGIDHDEPFFWTAIRSFSSFLIPSVIWVVTTYGIYIGLGALVFNYTFPILIVAPPFGWSQVSGLRHLLAAGADCTSRKTQASSVSATSLDTP